MEFKDKILHIRVKLDLSQEELARELRVAFVTLNRWENGHNMPTRKTLLQIKEYCAAKDIYFDEV